MHCFLYGNIFLYFIEIDIFLHLHGANARSEQDLRVTARNLRCNSHENKLLWCTLGYDYDKKRDSVNDSEIFSFSDEFLTSLILICMDLLIEFIQIYLSGNFNTNVE